MRDQKFKEALQKFGAGQIRAALRDLRSELSVTQEQLSQVTGIPRSVIAQWETGTFDVGEDRLLKIWKALENIQKQKVRTSVYAENIKELREEAGLTQRQVADLVGIRQETLSRGETDGFKNHLIVEKIRNVLLAAIHEKKSRLSRAEFLEDWFEASKRSLQDDLEPLRNLQRFSALAENIYQTTLDIRKLDEQILSSMGGEVDEPRLKRNYLQAMVERWTDELVLELVGWKMAREGAEGAIESLPRMISAAKKNRQE